MDNNNRTRLWKIPFHGPFDSPVMYGTSLSAMENWRLPHQETLSGRHTIYHQDLSKWLWHPMSNWPSAFKLH